MKFDVINYAEDVAGFEVDPGDVKGEAEFHVSDPHMGEYATVFMHWTEMRKLAKHLNDLALELRVEEEEFLESEGALVIPFPAQAINDYHNKEA